MLKSAEEGYISLNLYCLLDSLDGHDYFKIWHNGDVFWDLWERGGRHDNRNSQARLVSYSPIGVALQLNSILSNGQSDYTWLCVCVCGGCILKESLKGDAGQCISLWGISQCVQTRKKEAYLWLHVLHELSITVWHIAPKFRGLKAT